MKGFLVSVFLWYLRTAAKLQLAKVNPLIIGVAGSSGKSSLSRLIGEMLSDTNLVKETEGRNSETGLPLDILDLQMGDFSLLSWILSALLVPIQLLLNWKKYDVYVAEMGIDSPVEPKNMSYLLKIIRPTIAVVTNVSLEHSANFEPYVLEVNPNVKREKILEMTAQEETSLLTTLPQDGYAIVNVDDVSIRAALSSISSKKITVSLTDDADIMGKDVSCSLSAFSMSIGYQGKQYPLTISQPLPRHFAYEFLLALGVGVAAGLPLEEAISSLEKHFSLPAGRLSFFKGINDTILIDSTYNNATLSPIVDILDFVKEVSGKRRKLAIIGDMRELGEASKTIHEELAKKLVETVDEAILIGPLLEAYAVPLLKRYNLPFENFPHVTSAKEAILRQIQKGDVILIKGSQNTLFLERIVEMLLAHKEDIKKLTRRGSFWDQKRAESL